MMRPHRMDAAVPNVSLETAAVEAAADIFSMCFYFVLKGNSVFVFLKHSAIQESIWAMDWNEIYPYIGCACHVRKLYPG